MAFILPQILAQFATPPEESAYYSMFDNDYARERAALMNNANAEAYLNALSRSDFWRDMHRGFANSFMDVSPLSYSGRTSLAGNENMSLSDVFPASYYKNVQNVARRLYGPEKLSQNRDLGISGIDRLPDFDNAYAEKLVTKVLNATLPMDDPAVRDYAIKLFRSGQSLDEVSANTRSWILENSGTSSIDEYLKNRPNNVLNRGLQIAGSTLPIKVVKDALGYNDINNGYFGAGSNDIKKLKDAMMWPALAGILPLDKIPRVGKPLKMLLGPGMSVMGAGANATAAHSNLRDPDARKRFVMNAILKGEDPTSVDLPNVAYNAAQLWATAPYQMFTGAGQATQLNHAYKMMTNPEYRKSIQDMYKQLEQEGVLEAAGIKVRDAHGRLVNRAPSTTEMLSEGAGNALNWGLYAGLRRSKYILPLLVGYGAAEAGYDAFKKMGDKNNGVITDDDFNRYLAPDRFSKSASPTMRALSPYLRSAETGARTFANLLSHPIDTGRVMLGTLLDHAKYGIHNIIGESKNVATKEDKAKGEVYKTEAITAEEVRKANERRKEMLEQLNRSNKKTASEYDVQSLIPQAGISQEVEALKNQKLEMLPKSSAAYRMSDMYDQFGKYGPAGVAALLALKPRNAISNVFGDSTAYVEDLKRVRDEAKQRYSSKPYGFLPTLITSPFSREARAAHIAKKMHKDVRDFTKKNAFPLALLKTSAAGVVAAILLNKFTQPRIETPIYDYQ